MKIEYRKIDLLSLLWLSLGIIVFILGWCKWWISLPLTLLMFYCMFEIWRHGARGNVVISKNKFWCAFVICLILMLLCGIGGYVVQSNDNYWRNAMFRDLVNYSWPVYDTTTGLTKSYYIAFWMFSALLAKVTGSMEVGFFCQLLWMSCGMMLLFLQICRWVGKSRISYLWFFYFFSGLKIAECLLYLPIFGHSGWIGETIQIVTTNGSPSDFHAGPMSQLLYDPFNQTIPLFMVMMLMINNSRSRFLPFFYSLLMLYAPFPMVGLAPLFIYWWMRNLVYGQTVKDRLHYVVNISNVTAVLVLATTAVYLMSNSQSGNKGLREITSLSASLWGFFVYFAFEFGILLAVSYKACRDRTALWIMIIATAIMGWFKIGLHNDFCFRTNMPLVFITMLLVMRRYYMTSTSKKLRYFIVGWYIFAGIPAETHPAMRWLSSLCIATGTPQSELNNMQHLTDVTTLYVMQQHKMRNEDLQSSFRCRPNQYQFRTDVGTKDSFFFKYLAKRNFQ